MSTISVLGYQTPELEQRFWSKVDRESTPDGCWPWAASTSGHGYGQFYVHMGVGSTGKPRPFMALAHRAAYELEVGPIPDGLTIDHLCGTPLCVNPAHLEPVTHAENVRRYSPRHYNRAKTHCKNGHPYDRLTSEGGRICDRCKKEYDRARGRRLRAAARGG